MKGRYGVILLLPLCLFAGWVTLQTYSDYWGHLAVGRWVFQHGRAPTNALFLWTYSGPYIAHSWLSELVMYVLAMHLSESAMAALALAAAGLMGFAAFERLWRVGRISDPVFYPALCLFSVAVCAASTRFQPRPDMVSVLLFALLLSALVNRSQPSTSDKPAGPEWRVAVGLVILFALWTNLHGGMLAGLIALWVTAVCEVAQDRGSRRSIAFVGIAAMATLATLINPYGIKYYTIYTAVSTTTFANIAEWKPLFAAPAIPLPVGISVVVLVVAAVYCWFNTPSLLAGRAGVGWTADSRRWSHLALLLVFLAMTLQARRNVSFLVLVTVAAAAPFYRSVAAKETSKSVQQRDTPAGKPVRRGAGRRERSAAVSSKPAGTARWLVVAIVIYVVVLLNSVSSLLHGMILPRSPLIASRMADFVRSNHVEGPVFNDYDCGSYLEWRFAGRPGLFVDAANAYPDSVYQQYLAISNATPDGIKLLNKLGINCVLGRGLLNMQEHYPTLYLYVSTSPQWALAYFGPDGPVWVRRVPEYLALWQGVPSFTGRSPQAYLQYLYTDAHFESKQ